MLALSDLQVYLALGATDMRKSIDSLSILVEEHLELNPFSGSLFAFCNRRRNQVKILYWDRNGFCLWQKRLEKDFFRWPSSEKDILEIKKRELLWLLDGLDLTPKGAHKALPYSGVF